MSRVLAKRRLTPHADFPGPAIEIATKTTLVGSDVLKLEYVMLGGIAEVRLPAPGLPERAEDLWRHSCFEAFVGLGDGRGYLEYNFSPSRQWVIYQFESHRAGRHEPVDVPAPEIYVESDGSGRFALTASLDLKPLAIAVPCSLGLSAVIEDRDGALSYWALAHPSGKPDFHDRACFALELPAPNAP